MYLATLKSRDAAVTWEHSRFANSLNFGPCQSLAKPLPRRGEGWCRLRPGGTAALRILLNRRKQLSRS
jgi:hypothetical protein